MITKTLNPPISHALISVSNKIGVVEFAHELVKLNISILSTGGTAKALRDAGVVVKDVSDYTGFPEMMDGRVKTLHPKIYGGILGRIGVHDAVMEEHGIIPIGLVVVNLYPFKETVARPGCTREEAIENIDIGGPTMIRAAAKNYERVTVVVDPADYEDILDALFHYPAPPLGMRFTFAQKAFAHTAEYDQAIAEYLHRH